MNYIPHIYLVKEQMLEFDDYEDVKSFQLNCVLVSCKVSYPSVFGEVEYIEDILENFDGPQSKSYNDTREVYIVEF